MNWPAPNVRKGLFRLYLGITVFWSVTLLFVAVNAQEAIAAAYSAEVWGPPQADKPHLDDV
jgi:hypothetical protein